MGAAAENRPVIGSWKLAPDEALIIEVTPPEGLYWSYSLGNIWWETIDYGNRQSSLNGFQAVVDDDGKVRVVVAHQRSRASPTGSTPPGTAKGRSSCDASARRPPRCRRPGWCRSTGWPRSCRRTPDGSRRASGTAAIDIRRRAVSRRFAR